MAQVFNTSVRTKVLDLKFVRSETGDENPTGRGVQVVRKLRLSWMLII